MQIGDPAKKAAVFTDKGVKNFGLYIELNRVATAILDRLGKKPSWIE